MKDANPAHGHTVRRAMNRGHDLAENVIAIVQRSMGRMLAAIALEMRMASRQGYRDQ